MNFGSRVFSEEMTHEQAEQLPSQMQAGWLKAARASWIILAVISAAFFFTSLPGYVSMARGDMVIHGAEAVSRIEKASRVLGAGASITAAVLSIGLSGILFKRRFENPAVMAISFYMLFYGVFMAGVMEAWGKYWLGSTDFVITLQGILLSTPTLALFALFPNGRFVPKWMRWVLLVSIPWNIVLFFYYPLEQLYTENLIVTVVLFAIWMLLLPVFGVAAQIYRYKRVSTPDERHQTKWIMYGLGLWFGYIVFSTPQYIYLTSLPPGTPHPWWAAFSTAGWWLSLCILPLSFMVGITRYRLWNIDIVINRTLVYGGLTAMTMGFYIAVVGYLGNLLQIIDQSVIAFLATGLIAVLFQPLRDRIQRGVNRMMYGNRDEPVTVLSELGERLEKTGDPEDSLTRIVETVAQTLKLPYAAIELDDRITSYGIQKTEVVRLPLKYQAETIGYLAAGQRAAGESFSSADMALLRNIAQRAGAAAHAVTLTASLRQSRLKLVTMREEERHRIRRDLHDGLGPNLASMTLKLDAAKNLLKTSPDKAETMINEVKDQTQETIKSIRTLVYDLRPPALDELGLIGAVQNYIEINANEDLEIHFDYADDLDALSPAIEVAVYRTVLEGLTNIIRHAQAKSAAVRINFSGEYLLIEVCDDGIGMPDIIPYGVGLISMKERAEELGGALKISPNSPGTVIHVRIPGFKEQSR